MSDTNAIGPSYAGEGWFNFQGLPDAAARDPGALAALLMGVVADMGRIQVAPSTQQLRALLGAERVIRKQVGAGVDGWAWDDHLDLAGDLRPDDARGPTRLVSVADGSAWDWALSRLRWCLRSPAIEAIQSLEVSGKGAILDALQRVEGQLKSAASKHGGCA